MTVSTEKVETIKLDPSFVKYIEEEFMRFEEEQEFEEEFDRQKAEYFSKNPHLR